METSWGALRDKREACGGLPGLYGKSKELCRLPCGLDTQLSHLRHLDMMQVAPLGTYALTCRSCSAGGREAGGQLDGPSLPPSRTGAA